MSGKQTTVNSPSQGKVAPDTVESVAYNVQIGASSVNITDNNPMRRDYVTVVNQNANISTGPQDDNVTIKVNELTPSHKPRDVMVRLGDGHDKVLVDITRPLKASINGGSGNDTFLLNLNLPKFTTDVRDSTNGTYMPDGTKDYDAYHGTPIKVNGDGGVDTVILNPNDKSYILATDGKGTFTLKKAVTRYEASVGDVFGMEIPVAVLSGIERIGLPGGASVAIGELTTGTHNLVQQIKDKSARR